jgi:hypothetical protein
MCQRWDRIHRKLDLPAIRRGETVMARRPSAHDRRWHEMFEVSYLADAICVGLDVIAACVAIE